jgi:hypothetical protein
MTFCDMVSFRMNQTSERGTITLTVCKKSTTFGSLLEFANIAKNLSVAKTVSGSCSDMRWKFSVETGLTISCSEVFLAAE